MKFNYGRRRYPAPGDGRTDLNELAIVLASFGQTGFALPGDANGDGAVDLADLALVLARFGEACW